MGGRRMQCRCVDVDVAADGACGGGLAAWEHELTGSGRGVVLRCAAAPWAVHTCPGVAASRLTHNSEICSPLIRPRSFSVMSAALLQHIQDPMPLHPSETLLVHFEVRRCALLPQIVFFEGWMSGFAPLPDPAAAAAVEPALVKVNELLASYRAAWDELVDSWLVIRIGDPQVRGVRRRSGREEGCCRKAP